MSVWTNFFKKINLINLRCLNKLLVISYKFGREAEEKILHNINYKVKTLKIRKKEIRQTSTTKHL